MPKILVIGAHPDDCEIKAGGTALQWAEQKFDVTFVSVTDGRAGHHQMAPAELAERRAKEAASAARILGVTSRILGYPDGQILPTLEARGAIIRLIREEAPDLVLTHRPNDYHPDHRYTAQLVQDAAYLVTVPLVAPETPPLARNPIFGYLSDHFQKPTPFAADVVVPLAPRVVDRLVDALDAHESQFYEWLPFNMGILDTVPSDRPMRKELLREWYVGQFARRVEGKCVEAFEISEYGAPLADADRARLFPFAAG